MFPLICYFISWTLVVGAVVSGLSHQSQHRGHLPAPGSLMGTLGNTHRAGGLKHSDQLQINSVALL